MPRIPGCALMAFMTLLAAGCAADPPDICGDKACTGHENATTCPFDCAPPVCGDGTCEDFKGETAASCRADCHACGNGICEPPYETATDCLEDCHVCGNNICERPVETASNCFEDCHCGDGLCAYPENFGNCPQDCVSTFP